MGKRKRDNYQEIIDENILKIKKLVNDQRETYDKFVKDTIEHNLVIEKVTEKLTTDVLPNDISHFKGMLRNRYNSAIDLLHNCSDKIYELKKEQFKSVDAIAIAKKKLKT